MPARKKFLAYSCTHCPLESRPAVEWMLGQIQDFKPDVVVHLGDGVEADSASKWPNEATWDLQEEFDSFNKHLGLVKEAAGDAKLVFIPGNHDSNLLALNRIDKRLRGLADYRSLKNVPELAHWDQSTRYVYDRRRGVYRLGPVSFAHGFECAVNSDAHQSVLLGSPYGLFVSGHTHRPVPVTQARMAATVPIPYWYANAGTLRNIDTVSYMERKRRHLWGQAVVKGEVLVTKSPRMSKNWSAETVVYRMFDGETVH